MKKYFLVDNRNKDWCVRHRKDEGLLFSGTLPECYAWIKLIEGGYFTKTT